MYEFQKDYYKNLGYFYQNYNCKLKNNIFIEF